MHAPFTHDINKLADLSGLKFNEDYLDWLDTFSTFNMNVCYDSLKKPFTRNVHLILQLNGLKK